MTNKQYDTLKTIALILTPVLAFLASLVNIWGFPHGEQIVATLTDGDRSRCFSTSQSASIPQTIR